MSAVIAWMENMVRRSQIHNKVVNCVMFASVYLMGKWNGAKCCTVLNVAVLQ